MKKALVLGGGFAGVEAAIELSKQKQFDVTLISDRDYLFLFPISIWIPTRQTTFNNAKISLHKISKAHKFNVVIDKVSSINSSEDTVQCLQNTYHYDYLIVAFGANKLKPQGVENTLSICGQPEVSLQIRDALDKLIAKGGGRIAMGFGGNPKDKSAVRGGPGFELLFNVHNYLKRKGIRKNFELIFFAPMPKPGAKMGPGALDMMDKMFKRYNINSQVGKKILNFTPQGINFEDNISIESDFTMFIPAGTGNSLIVHHSDLPVTDAGFIKIDDHCLVEGKANVYAVGDAAALEGADWAAKQGHMAEIMSQIAAFNIAMQEGGSTERKGYQEHISIICVMDTGNGAAFVYRSKKRNFIIPMPIFGHWLKKAWGTYIKLTKTGKIPKLPGL